MNKDPKKALELEVKKLEVLLAMVREPDENPSTLVREQEEIQIHGTLHYGYGAPITVYLGGHLFPNQIMYAKYFDLNKHLLANRITTVIIKITDQNIVIWE